MTNSQMFIGACVAVGVGAGLFGSIVGAPFWATLATSGVGALAIIALFAAKGWRLDDDG